MTEDEKVYRQAELEATYELLKEFMVDDVPVIIPKATKAPFAVVVSEIWDNQVRPATLQDGNDKYGRKVLARARLSCVWEEVEWYNANNRVYYTHWMRLPDAQDNEKLDYGDV